MSEFREKLVGSYIYENSVKNYLEKIESIEEILIWRASRTGEIVYEFLKKFNLEGKVKGFIDSDPKKYRGGGTLII